mgnify:CR=1 FL=1
MKTEENTQFKIAADGKSVYISKQFNTQVQNLWEAWTDAYLLDQWWAPKPWICQTKTMEFREGGRWIYSMRAPEREIIWSVMAYEEIEHLSSFEARDCFCDEHGIVSIDLPHMHWRTEFSENELGTLLENHIRSKSAGDLQRLIDMGFRDGYLMGLSNLESLLIIR